jgi:hypothetical protein
MIGFKASDTIQTFNIPFQEEDYVKLFRFIKKKSENGKPKKEKIKKIKFKKEKKVRPDVASPKKRPSCYFRSPLCASRFVGGSKINTDNFYYVWLYRSRPWNRTRIWLYTNNT